MANGKQVVVNGDPAFTYVGDKAPGQTNGQKPKDRWGLWLALDPILVGIGWATGWGGVDFAGSLTNLRFVTAGPNGIHQTALFVAQTAHLRPGTLFAVLAGVTEFGGGVAMAAGCFTRLAGVALFGDMVLAMITVTWATGVNSTSAPPGYQVNLALAVLALVAALLGAGRFSLDAVITRSLRRPR